MKILKKNYVLKNPSKYRRTRSFFTNVIEYIVKGLYSHSSRNPQIPDNYSEKKCARSSWKRGHEDAQNTSDTPRQEMKQWQVSTSPVLMPFSPSTSGVWGWKLYKVILKFTWRATQMKIVRKILKRVNSEDSQVVLGAKGQYWYLLSRNREVSRRKQKAPNRP